MPASITALSNDACWPSTQLECCASSICMAAACSEHEQPAKSQPPMGTGPWTCAGLATVAAAVQRGGGTLHHTTTELDDELDALVAEVELGAAPESLGLGDSQAFCLVHKCYHAQANSRLSFRRPSSSS